MDNVIQRLKEELKTLEVIIAKTEKSLKMAPEGMLRVSQSNNSIQYYLRENKDDKNGKYIKNKDRKLAVALAQKEYDLKLLAIAKSQRNQLLRFLNGYEPMKMEQMYNGLSKAKQELIATYSLTQEQYIEQWLDRPSCCKPFLAGAVEIYTEKGERVRSKSEKILADKFYMMGIPYLYETSLYLQGFGVVYPDFLLLNRWTRKEFYWEHLGRMDDSEYSKKAIVKIEEYQRNGIIQGKNLIVTYETKEHPLNIKNVEMLIDAFL